MQAVILAGGKGTRLHPLTSSIPKPMVQLFDKPVLEHSIELLKQHDIHDIIITVAYKAEHIIDYFGNGSRWGVDIQYYIEEMPMGTAGGLRRIQPAINDTFLIISGDAVTDLDLTTALEFHKRNSAIATLLTYEVEDTSQFGIVESDKSGRIKRFQEKPHPSEAFSNTVNTGVYILEPEVISYVSYDTPYDFSRNVFPNLLRNSEPFYSYRADGYWCDIGNLAQYRNVHFDALMGKVKLNIPASHIASGVWIADGADVHPTVKLMSPVFVGQGAKIDRKTSLGRFAVIGSDTKILEGARITHSIMGAGSTVGAESGIFGSVVGPEYHLPGNRQLADEVVVHDGTDCGLKAEIDNSLLSQYVTNEVVLSWSGLEAVRLLSQTTSQPVAA